MAPCSISFPRMSTTAIRDQLRAISFLDGLTDSAYHQLARLVSPVRYEADQVLFEEGAPRSFLALVVSGAVAIEKQMNGRPHRLVRGCGYYGHCTRRGL